MKARDEELLKSEEFTITIGKANFTERVDGGSVMLEASSKCKMQYESDMEASRLQYANPFEYEDKLKRKLARQYELNAELDLENGKVKDLDLSGAEDDRSCVSEETIYYQPEMGYSR